MANHKSAIKSHKQSLKNKARNQSIISRIKTFVKKFEEALTKGNHDDSKEALKYAESEIMRGVTKGVYKLNTAARKVSRFTKKLKLTEAKQS